MRIIVRSDSRDSMNGVWLECLRYAGVVRVHESESTQMFDILAPKAVHDSQVWAEMNAQRINSFGIAAQAMRVR